MGEGDTATELPEAAENGNAVPEEKNDFVAESKDGKEDAKQEKGKESETDDNGESQKMDVDEKVGEENKDNKIENQETEEKVDSETQDKEDKVETKDEGVEEETAVEEETGAEPDVEDKVKVNENVEGVIEGSARAEEQEEEKGSEKRTRGKGSTGGKRKRKEKEEKEEQKTPLPSTIDRPVRERKSVERLVASIERDAVKEFQIPKGRGTALKDIPNVAYKLSRRKSDDTFKLLHTILFGRRGKAAQIKSNISRFSGFVWHENEEKQKTKIKEKLDKCVKEKLLEFCDVLDIPTGKTNIRKEDVVAKLMEFLEAPHATTTDLLAEKEQSSKGKKRKRTGKSDTSGPGSSKRSAKSQKQTTESPSGKKDEDKKSAPLSEDESEEDEDKGKEDTEEHDEVFKEEKVNGVPQKSEDEMSDHAESEEKDSASEDESEEDHGKKKSGVKKSSAKKEPVSRKKTKKVSVPKKSSPPPKKAITKTSGSRSKVDNPVDKSPATSSRKKKAVVVKEKSSTPKKSSIKEAPGNKVVKGKDQPKEEKVKPSDTELRDAICEILKKVDFNTATFTDILKLLAKQFDTDLTPRKSSIKLIIQDELTKLADEGEDEEDEADAEKDEKQTTNQGVKA